MIPKGDNIESKYELIVGAGHMDKDFSFIISQTDAKALIENPDSHAAFRNILYFSLQAKCFGENAVKDQSQLQKIFDEVAKNTINTAPEHLQKYISDKSKELNAALESFINKDIEKIKSGKTYTAWGI